MSGFRSFALALVLALGVPAVSHAQTDNDRNTAANTAIEITIGTGGGSDCWDSLGSLVSNGMIMRMIAPTIA